MNYNLTPGISLDDRNLIANIPDDTEIDEFKYIAKVDENNYIAEDFIEVDGYDGKCSIGYIRYLENNEPHQGIFYLKNNSNAEINVENIIFPKKFGIITEINEDAVLYSNIMRKSNEKVYVIGEDLSKKESLDKNTIQTNIEESVRSYGVPNNSVIGFDGDENDIPNGYELTNKSFGGGGTEVFICEEGQTIDDAPEEAKIIIDSNIVNSKAVNIINSMDGNETDIAPSVDAIKKYISKINEWKLVGTTTALNKLTLPNEFREILVTAQYNNGFKMTKIIPKVVLNETLNEFAFAGRATLENYKMGATFNLSLTEYQLKYVYIDGTEHSDKVVSKIYYR